jgi:multidrug transporter EmrE-like cation transporter
MLNILYLTGAVVTIAAQAIAKKAYNVKLGAKGAYTFNAVSVLAAALFFLFSSGFKLDFTMETFYYSLAFSVGYGMAIIGIFLAILHGSLSLTSLVTSYSLIIPTFWGIIFYNEKMTLPLGIGLVLLCISIFLLNSKKGDGRITLAWVFFALLIFFGNGACATVQLVQQRNFEGAYKSEFMIMGLAIVAVVLGAMTFFVERDEILPAVKGGGIHMTLAGLFNGGANLFVMLSVSVMNASIAYPVISAGGIILTWLTSRFVYKERLSTAQNISLVLGIVSVILMNI